MAQARTPTRDKYCACCGAAFNRTLHGGTLEKVRDYTKRVHCSRECAARARRKDPHTLSRSYRHALAQQHKREHCEHCNTQDNLHVHHIDRDTSNNSASNLMTLCVKCHAAEHVRMRREDLRKQFNASRHLDKF